MDSQTDAIFEAMQSLIPLEKKLLFWNYLPVFIMMNSNIHCMHASSRVVSYSQQYAFFYQQRGSLAYTIVFNLSMWQNHETAAFKNAFNLCN